MGRFSDDPPEQRRLPRFKTNIHAVASLVRDSDIVPFPARCETISEGGIGARGRRLDSLVAGDLVVLELYIPLLNHAFTANSIVRYVEDRRRIPRCGLQFLSLTDGQRALIKRYCQFLPSKRRWWFWS
ncbi:MAG TPA: PilZ domain-containing protein [Terriglobales bacterium]|nr:PilZ domain-containing protein [Terriglobales bacterium]